LSVTCLFILVNAQILLNRPKAIKARGYADPESRLGLSMFGQLFDELHFMEPALLRMGYTHPMDDGQQRTFKVKFEGEGVDDYGGPYREIFAQVRWGQHPPAVERPGGAYKCIQIGWVVHPTYKVAEWYIQHVPLGRLPSPWCRPPECAPAWQVSEELQAPMDAPTIDADGAMQQCLLPLLRPTPNAVTEAGTGGAGAWQVVLQPSRRRYLDLEMYSFLGQLVGIALRSRIYTKLQFPVVVWKALVGEPVVEADLADLDRAVFAFIKNTRQLLLKSARGRGA
jgi:hypothetical protein